MSSPSEDGSNMDRRATPRSTRQPTTTANNNASLALQQSAPAKYAGDWGGGGLQPSQRTARPKSTGQPQQQLQSGLRPANAGQQPYGRQPRRRPDGQAPGQVPQRSSRGDTVARGDATADARLAEVGSLSRPGSKKGANSKIQSYNSYSHDRPYSSSNYRTRRQSPMPWRNQHGGAGTANYNKERYLQANCRFVVVDGIDYEPYLADADKLVEWDNIEEVRLLTDEPPACPICLHPPTAAKITRCGHVYCWPCVLHYLALSDDKWRKCPICYESVYANQLKSAVATVVDRFAVDQRLNLSLMRRERGSAVAVPAAQWTPDDAKKLKHLNAGADKFAKLLVVSAEEVQAMILDRERTELDVLWALEHDEPESCFITLALSELDERRLTLLNGAAVARALTDDKGQGKMKESNIQSTPIERSKAPVVFADAFNDVVLERGSEESMPEEQYLEKQLDEEPSDELQQLTLNEAESYSEALPSPTDSATNCYHFYQTSDGQPVFLHPVNARCLVAEFGGLDKAPATIEGRILQIETFSMTPEVRDRFRYLSHLPLTTQFSLVELQFDRGLLSKPTIDAFSGELAKRQKARQRQQREDARRAERAEQWERAMLLDPNNYAQYSRAMSAGNDGPPDIPVVTYVQSAQHDIQNGRWRLQSGGSDDAASLSPNENFPSLLDHVQTPPPSTHQQTAPLRAVHPAVQVMSVAASPPSFAEMLKSRPKAAGDQPAAWPSLRANQAQPVVLTPSSGRRGNDEEEDGGGPPVPDFHSTFGMALQAALDGPGAGSPLENVAGRKKGKKKPATKLLFATGMAAPTFG
uniref:E3 ubiquitin-protein ligase RNF10 n=1 Tax=Plectus sambesii TaxID=2011161 RepID=A0A914VT00_9BILA